MFQKILIANRGEIACRIIKTARRMGIKTVAVYSDADHDGLHVEMADESVNIGPAPAVESYLLIERIITACKDSGAQAVHPGYGFLSEREAFAVALQKAGVVFIGPNAKAIAAMGDKIESKKAAARAKVTTVPGHLGAITDAQDAVRVAAEVGYPVMIKASAGGGGKGMRIAYNSKQTEEGYALARSEAKASFGDDRLLIEKYIENPRHIEIQVLGDKHGNIIHLGERECSIQRRNQKVVEEAPSPLLDSKTRNLMGEQAVALAKAVGYDSAGTVEFVAGQDRSFYFLEMNTRLQVEHPVTELVTGIDLVEQMIRIAAGEKLTLRQADVRLKGAAIEARVYAEDPSRDFLPSIGRLVRYRPPREGSVEGITVRNDTGVAEGSDVSVYYDPLIAKLCTHGPTRLAAIDAMARALDDFTIEGIAQNLPFLSALMQSPRWREGKLSTGFIKEEYPEGFVPRPVAGKDRETLAAVATAIDHVGNARRRQITQQMTGGNVRFAQMRIVAFGRDEEQVHVEGDITQPITVSFVGGDGSVRRRVAVESSWWPGEPLWTGLVGGEKVAAQVRPIANGVWLAHRGVSAEVRVYTLREATLARLMPEKAPPDTSKLLLCPMPGLLKAMLVQQGQAVKAGDNLVVVEAMKMENVLKAGRDGVVKTLKAKPGDSLAVDAVILEFA